MVNGTVGNDTLTGPADSGTMHQSGGGDLIFGIVGSNLIFGGRDDDLAGAAGNDPLYVWGGSDALFGAGGDDHLCGGVGEDLILSQNGNGCAEGGAEPIWICTVQ